MTAEEEKSFLEELDRVRNRVPRHLDADESNAAQGLARLVLGLVDLLRQLLERQAIRRMEGESLSEEEMEKLGRTFMLLDAQLKELCQAFGIDEKELDLGIRLDSHSL
jgi:hypothetical protein